MSADPQFPADLFEFIKDTFEIFLLKILQVLSDPLHANIPFPSLYEPYKHTTWIPR